MKKLLYLLLKQDMINKLKVAGKGEQFIDDVITSFDMPTSLLSTSYSKRLKSHSSEENWMIVCLILAFVAMIGAIIWDIVLMFMHWDEVFSFHQKLLIYWKADLLFVLGWISIYIIQGWSKRLNRRTKERFQAFVRGEN